MDTNTAIFERRTVHAFNSKKVDEKLIYNAINAANQAPCHRLTFPWRFYSIGKSKRNEILKLAIDIKSSKKSLDENSKKILFLIFYSSIKFTLKMILNTNLN